MNIRDFSYKSLETLKRIATEELEDRSRGDGISEELETLKIRNKLLEARFYKG